ncbi:MAG: hypothetical protein HYY05_03655, partial [Chloroflexi bacterium]|nr:hypothetical protein [Chloroflexota bacterium]
MCRQCGCVDVIEQGPEAVLQRAIAIVRQMGITPDNVQRFEDGERICSLIASKLAGQLYDEIRRTAEWVSELHEGRRADRSEAYMRAARDVFANLPAGGDAPRETITTWHQLEQLCHGLGEEALSRIEEPAISDALRAVQHVHEDPRHMADLRQRYGLE